MRYAFLAIESSNLKCMYLLFIGTSTLKVWPHACTYPISRFDTTSTSGNDSDEELIRQQLATIANLRRSIEKTHITSKEQENTIPEQNEGEPVANFKLGPAGGQVRPRMARSMERERTVLALSLGNPNELWDLTVDKDSDVDKSVNTGTEEHSSFSEQAWDFYQVCVVSFRSISSMYFLSLRNSGFRLGPPS